MVSSMVCCCVHKSHVSSVPDSVPQLIDRLMMFFVVQGQSDNDWRAHLILSLVARARAVTLTSWCGMCSFVVSGRDNRLWVTASCFAMSQTFNMKPYRILAEAKRPDVFKKGKLEFFLLHT